MRFVVVAIAVHVALLLRELRRLPDADGDVVGARMLETRPGTRGDQAANAIWSFRYLAALDDSGRAVTSSLDQPFQIR